MVRSLNARAIYQVAGTNQEHDSVWINSFVKRLNYRIEEIGHKN